MLIRYDNGRVEPATLLGASHNAMRVALRRNHASCEFTRLGGQWLSWADGPVEVDFTAAATEREWRLFCERLVGLDDQAPWDADSLLAGCGSMAAGEEVRSCGASFTPLTAAAEYRSAVAGSCA